MKETEQTLLDQIKDQVAKEKEYSSWEALEKMLIRNNVHMNPFWPIVCERYSTAKAKAIASKVAAMQKEIEDNHDGDPWNNGAITTLEEVKKLFDQPTPVSAPSESQEDMWNEIEKKYIDFHEPKLEISELMNHFKLIRINV